MRLAFALSIAALDRFAKSSRNAYDDSEGMVSINID